MLPVTQAMCEEEAEKEAALSAGGEERARPASRGGSSAASRGLPDSRCLSRLPLPSAGQNDLISDVAPAKYIGSVSLALHITHRSARLTERMTCPGQPGIGSN